jgi:hypothetical protein
VAVVDVEARARAAGRAFCAAVSSASDEPLTATASRLDHWILVEYRGAWSRDVLGESLLSAELKTHLREQLDALEPSRLLFLKKPEHRARAERSVFFGTSRPGQERFFRLEVEHQEDLRGFDFAAALAVDGASAAPLEQPLFVVCTHGKRDRCCALRGRPLYDALLQAADSDLVWQSTHVGGDRFAGNLVVFPHGLYYGRVEPADTADLVASHRSGRVDLDHYRGRCGYSCPVQAAEQAIRESEGVLGIDDLRLVGSQSKGEGAWRIRFRTPDAAVHETDVAASLADEPIYLTCESAEPRRARRYGVTARRTVSR